jgi:hypothetical protein
MKELATKAPEKYKEITQEQYYNSFRGDSEKTEDKAKLALEHALDIRKFEIDLYWKRATYFWTLIGADLVGYSALQVSTVQNERTIDLSILLSCIGIVFSLGWFCVNKGSKQWQENWESHVDMLEDGIIGPLYKTVLIHQEPSSICKRCKKFIVGPGEFSVSKINQLTSFFVTILWGVLLFNSLGPFSNKDDIACTHLIYVICALGCCVAFFTCLGKTASECKTVEAALRTTTIASPAKNDTAEEKESSK